jgi:hypothetical protein
MPATVADGGRADMQIRKKASISASNDVKNHSNMPKHDSLDGLISRKAAEYADQIKAAAAMAANEEEIRIESEKQLAFIQKEAGIKLEGKHEFTVASGRIDSVYSRVIIEYKNPKSPGDRIGPKADSPGSKKVVEQIKKRFYDMRAQHGQPMNSLFGVGLDGNHFIFVRFRDEKWQVQEPVEVSRHSAERFLWALFNLGNKGKAFSAEYLAGDFGSEGGNTVAIEGIHALYDAIVTTDNPKAQVFFSQWKILFGEVCGYDVENPSDKIKKLAEFYQVGVKGVKNLKAAELLFAVHTYYALFMKLLASEIVAFFHKLPTPLQKMMQAGTSAKLKREMDDLEAGSIFRHLNITNFLEGDLFAWYTGVWTDPIEKLVREMVARLDNYNPGTLSEDPAGSRDLLKQLYQQLFPKSVRHDLGEYYTPDWLAEHVLNELGYTGDPDKRLLDPAAGSGTFLVMAINRIRQWYDVNREKCHFDEGELCRKILSNVIGFDLNPLAVMAARTNYLIAIRDLIGHVDKVEIPVYLCDSILTPAEYGELLAGRIGEAKSLKTAAATFIIPAEITKNRDDVAKYAELLESCVRSGYSPKEFLQRCRDENLPVSVETLHCDLYSELVALDKANKNGVWARIIKNAFAPLFVGKVDFVAGNPPWVRWGYLPREYREATTHLWQEYGLFSLKGYEARLGSGEKDLSQLFVYSCLDNYLNIEGKLGFLITQTVLKAKGQAEGFRKFRLGEAGVPFRITSVDDFSNLQPFEGATNLTISFVCVKGQQPKYPVPYKIWTPTKGKPAIPSEWTLEQVCEHIAQVSEEARPVDPAKPNSHWQTTSRKVGTALTTVIGPSPYKAKIGARTDPYGVFQIRILKAVNKNTVLIENCADAGKREIQQVQVSLEKDLVHPLIRGRDVDRWTTAPKLYVLMVQNPETRTPIPEGVLKRDNPLSFSFLSHFKPDLLARGSGVVKALMETTTFYAMFAVGVETYAPFKVVWRRMGNDFRAAFASSVKDEYLGEKLVIPSDTVTFVPFHEEKEAYFFLGLINSTPARAAIYSFSPAGRGLGAPSIMQNLKIGRYQAATTEQRNIISGLAKKISGFMNSLSPDFAMIDGVLKELDSVAAEYWKIPSAQLLALAEAVTKRERRSS